MSQPTRHEVQLVASSLDEIRHILGVDGDLPATVVAGDGIELTDVRVSKSSGFETTQFVLDAVVTVATSVSSGVLTAWINEKLKRNRRVVATVDGEEVLPLDADET
jgi:hypothetical protein